QDEYMATNQAIVQQLVQYTDNNLQLIERNIVIEMYKNKSLQSFFDDSIMKSLYDYYFIQESLNEFATSLPFVSSIYLYSESQERILTGSGQFSLSTFADTTFLTSVYEPPGLTGWSNVRGFRQSVLDQ